MLGECNPPISTCRLYVSVENRANVRLAHMFSTLMFDPEGATGPELTLIDVPEWPETQILVFPEQRLTPEQAAAAFTLGESVITSAADPKRAGQSVREVGTNPFIIGDPAYEGNWMYEFFKRHKDTVSVYVINTGGVGELRRGSQVVKPVLRVQIPEMARIIAGILRGEVRWRRDPLLEVDVAEYVLGVNLSKFNPARHYDWPTLSKLVSELKAERREWLSKFPGLRREVLEARY